jgi:hypothetical protein
LGLICFKKEKRKRKDMCLIRVVLRMMMKLLMLGIECHDHDEIAAISKGKLLVNRDYQN